MYLLGEAPSAQKVSGSGERGDVVPGFAPGAGGSQTSTSTSTSTSPAKTSPLVWIVILGGIGLVAWTIWKRRATPAKEA